MKQLGTWPGITPQKPYSDPGGDLYPGKPPPQCGLQAYKAKVKTLDLHTLETASTHCKYYKTPALWSPAVAQVTNPDK